jgi:cytochrome c oxidase subunit 3
MSEPTPEAAAPAKASSAPPPASAAAAHDHGHGDGHHGHSQYPHLAHHFDTPQQQFDAGKLGIWLFLLTEVLFFAGLFCAYTVYRAIRPEVFVYAHYYLDTTMGAINTCVLLLSSLTAAWAVRNAQLGQHNLLKLNIAITIACACTFMVVKYFEYSHKVHDGLLWGPNFAPKVPVWELESFKKKHPEAAEYAHKLAEHSKQKAAAGAAPAAAGAAPATAAAGPAVPLATGSQAVIPPLASGSAAPIPSPAAHVDAPPTGSSPAAAASAAPTASAPAAPATAAPAPAAPVAAAPAPAANAPALAPLPKPSRAALEPLLKAGLVGEKAEQREGISRPRNAHVFFGIYFFMTGLHGLHVLIGIGIFIWMFLKAQKGVFGPNYFGPIDYSALYWHLVDLIWIYLFPLLYLIH